MNNSNEKYNERDAQVLSKSPDIALITDDIKTKEELHKAFVKYIKLPKKNKRYSDYYSVQIYGYNVPTMYVMTRDYLMEESEQTDDAPVIPGESFVVSEPDLYYNKAAFDSGNTNLCFVIGYSGSGKSYLTREYSGEETEKVSLDDIVCIKDHISMEELKEERELLYKFFSGKGSVYYVSREERKAAGGHSDAFVEFIKFAMEYAASHKDRKFILEGIWTYLFFDDPSEFEDYAVFMKGTSYVKSQLRRTKRELSGGTGNTIEKIAEFGYYALDSVHNAKNIDIWRRYFENKPETVLMEEDNRFNHIKEDVMNELNAINDCYVHEDREGIEEIIIKTENAENMTLTEKGIIVEECKRAISDL